MTNAEQSLDQTVNILAEKSNAGVEVLERAEFELDIVTAASNTITQEKLSKGAEIFLQGLSPKTLIFGLKKRHNGLHPRLDSRNFIDLRMPPYNKNN